MKMMDLPKCTPRVRKWLEERKLVPVWDYMLEELIDARRIELGDALEHWDDESKSYVVHEFRQRAWGAYNSLLVLAGGNDLLWGDIYSNVKWYVR